MQMHGIVWYVAICLSLQVLIYQWIENEVKLITKIIYESFISKYVVSFA